MTSPSRRVSGRFWGVPAGCAGAAGVLAVVLGRVDRLTGDEASSILFPGPPEGARSFLGAVITAMISFTGLVFSITVVVLVLTSGQFSPRVLRQFLRDSTIRWSLGLFVATFVYAVFTLREVLGTNSEGAFVPRLSITVAFLLVMLAVVQFVRYIHHVVHMIQASSIINSIGAESRDLLEARHPAGGAAEPEAPEITTTGRAVTCSEPGTVVAVEEEAMVRRARHDDVVAVVRPRVGDFVPAGATLLTVHPRRGGADPDLTVYAAMVRLGEERTMDQDVAFGLRQLVDIAVKALSPSINDPTTAAQALDVLHDLLRRVVSRPWQRGRFADDSGTVRLSMPVNGVEDLLRIGLCEIHHYGNGAAQVPERITRLLDDLESVVLAEHRDALHRVRAELGRSSPDGTAARPRGEQADR